MKLGLSTYSYGWAVGAKGNKPEKPLTVYGLLENAEKYGLHLIQIGDNLPLDQFAEEELDRIYSNARNKNIELEVGTRGYTLEQIQLYIKIAEKLHSKIIRIVTDKDTYEPSVDMIIDITKKVLPELEETGITLAIENHDRFLSEQLAGIMLGINSRYFGICLDMVNSMGAGEGIKSVVENLAPWTVNVHIKDFTIRRLEHLMGFIIEGSPAGEGMLDIPGIIEDITRFNRNPNVILELWTPPESNLNDTIIKEQIWVERSMSYLKTII